VSAWQGKKKKKKRGAKQECQMEENKTDNVICISHRTKKQKQEMGIIDILELLKKLLTFFIAYHVAANVHLYYTFIYPCRSHMTMLKDFI